MRAVKIAVIVLVVYALVVVVFETLLGSLQPVSADTVVITTTDAEGKNYDRVLSGLDSGGKFYVAVNHWPRAWYCRLLENPDVRITRGGDTQDYVAVAVSGEERTRVEQDHSAGIVFRILTGFPPRHFIRLDPLGG